MNALIDGIEQECSKHIFGTYARFPVAFVRGEGCRLWDDAGKEYLDFLAGIAVCGLGHCHPEVALAVSEAARKLVHVSNLFYTYPQVELAAELTRLSFADKVFFSNSGAEANEAAIKLARKYSRDTFGPGRFHIISMKDSFHGRTMATLSATGQSKVHQGFEPLVEGFVHVDFNSVSAVEAAITDKTCAVMVEPVQGEGGLNFPAPGYLRDLKALCKERKLLLIFDEVQSGLGRTGSLFAYEQEDVTPDIMTLAKALANGLPMGAMLAVDEVAGAFTPGSHASTFGGGPAGCLGGPGNLEDHFRTRFPGQGARDRGLFHLKARGTQRALFVHQRRSRARSHGGFGTGCPRGEIRFQMPG